jgi:desulfoferrodoxin (superoxide reductase-like protein)
MAGTMMGLVSRRRIVSCLLSSAATVILRPAMSPAEMSAAVHQPILDAPRLAEDPTAVPVRVAVDHPMDPDHFIESVEVVLEADSVPHKGTYRLTPANGRVRLAFPMRSGTGGLLKAIATCNRHGRFVGTREIRVGGDGCATESDGPRERPGKPRIRVMGSPKPGEVVEVAVKLDHESDTGLRLKNGTYARVRPEYFVKEMQVFLGNQRISDFRLTSALSSNAILRFPVRVPGASTLRVVVVNSEGRRWEATERIRVDA